MKSMKLALCCLLVAAPVGAGADVFRYETDDGVIAFTDSKSNVPKKYRERADVVDMARVKVRANKRWTVDRVPAQRRHETLQRIIDATVEVESDTYGIEPKPATDHEVLVLTREFRWVPHVYGAPGDVYTLMDVVRNQDGEVVAIAQSAATRSAIQIHVAPR